MGGLGEECGSCSMGIDILVGVEGVFLQVREFFSASLGMGLHSDIGWTIGQPLGSYGTEFPCFFSLVRNPQAMVGACWDST